MQLRRGKEGTPHASELQFANSNFICLPLYLNSVKEGHTTKV